MNEIEKREITGLQEDRKNQEKELKQNVSDFAYKLKMGMGEEMMREIKNPSAIKIERGFKYKFKKWLKEIKESLRFLFYN